jgi:hypothetical protein
MLIFLIAGAVGGATSAFYLAYNYHPLLVNGVIHFTTCRYVFCQEVECAYYWLVSGWRITCASCNTFYNNRGPCSVDWCEPHLAEFSVPAVNYCIEQQS